MEPKMSANDDDVWDPIISAFSELGDAIVRIWEQIWKQMGRLLPCISSYRIPNLKLSRKMTF